MKNNENKLQEEMYEKEDLSKRYGTFRVRYPEGFLKMLIKNHCKGNGLAVDLATGTGFLAHLLSSEFQQVKAIDISYTQIQVASELFESENLEFIVENAYNTPEMLTALDLPSPDLLTIAQSLHWVDQNKLYFKVSEAMDDNSVFMLIAYSSSLFVSDGENYNQLVSTQVPGYEIHNACPYYQLLNDTDIFFLKEVNIALKQYWDSIYKCMYGMVPNSQSFIDRYYQDVVLPEQYLTEMKRYLWFTVEKKTSEDIINMASAYASHKVYLSQFKIQEGSNEDPLQQLKNIVLSKGPSYQFDLIIPFFCVVTKKAH